MHQCYGAKNSYCVEVIHPRWHEGLRHLFGRHNAGHGVTVPDGLPHGDDVGHEVLSLKLEGPEVGANATETHLDLISYENAPCFMDMSVGGADCTVNELLCTLL